MTTETGYVSFDNPSEAGTIRLSGESFNSLTASNSWITTAPNTSTLYYTWPQSETRLCADDRALLERIAVAVEKLAGIESKKDDSAELEAIADKLSDIAERLKK